MEKEALLLDNVESSWRGILDMTVNDVDKTLYGVTSTPVYFGLWAAPLEEMHFEDNAGKVHYEIKKGLAKKNSTNINVNNNNEKPRNMSSNNNMIQQISEAQKFLQQKNIDIDLNNILGNYLENKNVDGDVFKTPKKEVPSKEDSPIKNKDEKYLENMNNVIKNNILNPPKPFQKKKYELPEQMKSPLEFPVKNDEPVKQGNEKIIDYEEEWKEDNNNILEKNDMDISPKNLYNMPVSILEERKTMPKLNENPVQENNNRKSENINEKDFDNSIVNPQNSTLSNDLHFASFIIDKDNNEKYQQFDLINELSKEHSKFVSVLATRNNYIKPIVHYLNAGNIKSALFLLSK